MTPAERQTVIDALEAALGYLEKVQEEYATRPRQYIREFAELNAALAIMRRGREPAGEVVRIPGYSCGRCGCADVMRDDPR